MMYGYDFSSTGGIWMLAAMVIMAVALLGSVWLIVHRPGATSQAQSAAAELLRERFARGEISAEQFDETKKRLG